MLQFLKRPQVAGVKKGARFISLPFKKKSHKKDFDRILTWDMKNKKIKENKELCQEGNPA